jgi:Ca-activated chloride channel family protein
MTQTLQPMTDEMLRSVTLPPSDDAGFGALRTEKGVLPLKALDVQARVDGLLAETRLTQTFVNAHAEPLEATYIFPLPDRAAVTRFRLEVAGRVVEGELKERGAARKEYDEAIKEGHRAAITEEERPGVFTMRVGNLPPGETARVELTLTGPLPYADGEATFRFPLVVAPRYIPGTPLPGPSVGEGVAADTDAVPDASRITPPVLLPGFPNPVRLSLAVEFAPSPLAPSALQSSLHAVVEETTEKGRRVVVQPGERLNRDFILRFRVGAEKIVTSLSLQPDADGEEGTFALTLVPPAPKPGEPAASAAGSKPRDVVFVLDRSGSMGGWKMVAARRAMARMVDTLTDRDRFTVYAFDDVIETPPGFEGNKLVDATNHHRSRAAEFLSKIDARGGTEMAQPLAQGVGELNALAGDRKTLAERDRILVLVTDGQVGHEDQILRELGKQLKNVRVFTLGVDRAVNEAFLKRLADLGGGASRLVESEDRLDEVMDDVHCHIGTAVLTNLRLEPAGLAFVPGSVVPSRMPDLFAGSPLTILGRYTGSPQGAVALQARDAAGGMWQAEVKANRAAGAAPATVWARGKLRDLEDRYVVAGGPELEKEIVATSLRFGVLCRFTAFVAVDRSAVVNAGGQVHGIVQPVEMPEGWAPPGVAYACAGAMPMTMGMVRAPRKLTKGHFTGASTPLAEELCDADFSASGEDETCQTMGLNAFRRMPAAPPPRPDWQRRIADALAMADAAGVKSQRVMGLLQSLGLVGDDAHARWEALRSIAEEVEQLIREAGAAGVEGPLVKQLEDCRKAVEALRTDPMPSDSGMDMIWGEVVKVLLEYHARMNLAPADRRERFWA